MPHITYETWRPGADARAVVEQAEPIGCDAGEVFEVRRIALNMDQVQTYSPPPNPAKITDSRAQGYIALHGHESWELDALEPQVLDALIARHIRDEFDPDEWEATEEREATERRILDACTDRWGEVRAFLEGAAS